ncbi:histidine phosphatase family protein [Marinovum sp.]|uniref:histidine phosphatase family protein n=1 Tax=Marinovum sp. TaxID=2024839 RepID=UPI003A919512
MADLIVVTHPEVTVDPAVPVPEWGLSDLGRARAQRFALSGEMEAVTRLCASTETKARETAEFLAEPRALPLSFDARLGENDRSATGFLPPEVFEAAADAFFATPAESHRGWETALAAQARIVQAVRELTAVHDGGDLAIVTHGAVGTLLYCHLMGLPIDRRYDQPSQGHHWRADLATLRPRHGWRPL